MRTWLMRNAKARFDEFLDAAVREGPRAVTCRAIEIAVVVSVPEWKRSHSLASATGRPCCWAQGPRFEMVLPERESYRRGSPSGYNLASSFLSGWQRCHQPVWTNGSLGAGAGVSCQRSSVAMPRTFCTALPIFIEPRTK
jgi:antitoxin Phd